MIVYRYEHPKDGMGPYADPDGTRPRKLVQLGDKLRSQHGWCSKHPAPYTDAKMRLNWDSRVCGMTSEEGLRKWFWGFNKKLQQTGFVRKAYQVPSRYAQVSARTGQVVFNRNRATPLPTPPLPRAAKGKRSARGTSELRSL